MFIQYFNRAIKVLPEVWGFGKDIKRGDGHIGGGGGVFRD